MRGWALALLLSALGCAAAPSAPRPGRPPPRAPADEHAVTERAAGDIVGDMLEGEHGLYADAALASYVQAVGERVAKGAGETGLSWRFRLTDDAAVGARALPGGRVVISRATLAYLGSEAELAAVLGHEIAHVVRRHGTSRVGLETPERPDDSSEHARRADGERQADDLAVRYLARAGYDARAVARALEGLARSEAIECARLVGRADCAEDDGSDPHAAWPARLARTTLAAGSARGETGRERYLGRIDGLLLGDSASAPRLVGDRFEANGGPSIALPAGSRPELSGGLLSTSAGGKNLVIARAHGDFWRSMLRRALKQSPHAERDVAGFHTLIGSFAAKDSEPARVALLEAKPFIYLIAVSGDGGAERALLDELLASVRPASARSPDQRRVRIVRASGRATLARLCATTPVELATALNGVGAKKVIAAGEAVKCVEVSR